MFRIWSRTLGGGKCSSVFGKHLEILGIFHHHDHMTPSVPNGNSSGPRERVLALMDQKKAMEEEIDALTEVLNLQGVGLNGPLVTADGFPRNDVDIPTIRENRVRIIRLENDIKALMVEIEAGLLEVFGRRSDDTSGQTTSDATNGAHGPVVNGSASGASRLFARIESVSPNSPAAAAGLQQGDEVLRFGTIDASNNNALRALPAELQRSQVPVTVVRDGEILALTLRPNSNWGGRGSLGCHVLPI